uniref:Glutathione peroxidase n=1 Tax=Lotharella globosa TaxID=91324 RepID=A0A6V3M3C8_9EUKA|mmetsp:Transcript_9113/g.17374  ORF Transcript_9113/g.17374 Transcript_9113/m.17374 type:complete len:125 (+) Transcript_9113:59-433(+)
MRRETFAALLFGAACLSGLVGLSRTGPARLRAPSAVATRSARSRAMCGHNAGLRRSYVPLSQRRSVQMRGFFDNVMQMVGMSSEPKFISPMEFYRLQTTTLDGKPFSFEQLKGKTVLITNVASK